MTAITIKDVTVKERILLHLERYSYILPGQEFNVPFDLTQDGIAMVVGITRSHASLDLKKLGESGMVTNWQARQKGVRTRRLVYTITPSGLEKAKETREKLEKGGIDVAVILDMRKCDPQTKWNALTPEDREVFGKVCVLRVPVPRETFPPTPSGTLPTDVYGLTSIPPEVSRTYLEKVPPEDIRRWNSWAADWWLDQGNKQERLYHLVSAGRMAEAEKLAVRSMDEFIANPNEDLLALLGKILVDNEYAEDIVWLKSQVAVACGNIEEAKRCSKYLGKFKSPMQSVVDAQICMIKNEYKEAYALAENAYESMHTPLSAIIMAQACARAGDLKQADALAVRACDAMHEIGDAKDIDEILKTRAEIAYKSGDKDSALALLGKAKAAAPVYKQEFLQNIADAISAPGTTVNFD